MNFQILMRVYFNPPYYNSTKVVELYQKNRCNVDVMFHRDCYMILGKCEINELEKIKEICINLLKNKQLSQNFLCINGSTLDRRIRSTTAMTSSAVLNLTGSPCG